MLATEIGTRQLLNSIFKHVREKDSYQESMTLIKQDQHEEIGVLKTVKLNSKKKLVFIIIERYKMIMYFTG